MIELDATDFHKVKPLFKEIKHSEPLVFSIIEGNSAGRVFVDRSDAPTCAYLTHEGAFHYVAGDAANEEFNQAMVSLIFHNLLTQPEAEELVLFAFSEIWRETLDELLSHHGAKRIHRKMFAFNPANFQSSARWQEQLPEGFYVQLIDQQLAEKQVAFKPLLEAKSQRFGVCLRNKNEIATVCQAVCVGGGMVEIDIHTEEKHRERGFAFLTASAFIEETLQRNLIPNWSCWPEREPSVALAKKLGFDEIPVVPAHFWMEGLN